MSMNIYVGNLSYRTTENELTQLFASYGQVDSAKIITDRDSGQSKGFGFIEMANKADGEKAIAELNGRTLGDRQIKVNESKPRQSNNNRGGGGGYGGGRGGSRW